jgi:hypothetical protein
MRLTIVGVSLALTCVTSSVLPYTVKTYHGAGATRIEACSLAKATAQSPDEETAHGRLSKISDCQCENGAKARSQDQWHCLVQATHDN